MGYVYIILSSAAVYLFIVISIRLFGKTEIAQLSVADLVFIMLLSNAVQNAMVGSDTSLMGGLVAAGTLFVINAIFKECLYRIPWFGRVMQGESVMLIYQGKVNDANMRKAKLTTNELLEAIREHGVAKIADVNLAVLEVDGNISVLSNDFQTKTTKAIRRSRLPKRQTKKQD
ncbi:MAG: DUF421 domain-containing protein [Solobacterium sp.]|jgi:uncharacterized membrane protein YcaP (DUF421 family)|nr:DUF421 domain-containing protein [Solobacterium sp.]MCH4204976.1 DUF421 domain-containing protein [Solobacterium sp.]MCH4226368.1 DUF421 domain-containing protein [Solobacterium sp.]MCH4281769.1 DUF421 domain-containing protein [Solobacterium sp.]